MIKTNEIRVNRIEQILEKGSGRLNEDCLLAKNNIFGVFDGASSIDNRLFQENRTGGYIAAQTAKNVFAKNHFPLHTLGITANEAIRSQMHINDHRPEATCQLWSTSAAVIRVKNESIEWLKTGDAQIIAIYRDGTFKVMSQRDDHDFETLRMLKETDFKMTQAFKAQVQKVRSGMNIHYGVLNGRPEAVDFLDHGHLDVQGLQTVLLFTDGLNLPDTNPSRKRSYNKLVNLFLKLGLEGLKDYVRAMEASDPDIRKYPRFKCHDDIAAVAIHIDK